MIMRGIVADAAEDQALYRDIRDNREVVGCGHAVEVDIDRDREDDQSVHRERQSDINLYYYCVVVL